MNDEIKARIAAKRAELEKNELGKKSSATSPSQDFSEFADAIPEVHDEKKSSQIQNHQQFIDSLSIVDVYAKLSGKRPRFGANQVNGIPGFCVAPDHPNTDDEAMQMNREDNTWVCHGQCDVGSGTVGLVALSMGMKNVAKGQLRGVDYAKAEEELLKMFGWQSHKGATGKTYLVAPEPKAKSSPPPPAKKAEPKQPEPVKLASVTNIDGTSPDDEEEIDLGVNHFDWRDVVPRDTYAWNYMEAASHDDCIEAFHFGYMMLTLAATVGRRFRLDDQYNVYPNLFLTMLGDSGTGKSKAANAMTHVLEEVLPYDPTEEPQIGARLVGGVGTGQAITMNLRREVRVPNPSGQGFVTEIRGDRKTILEYGEMETLTQKLPKDTTGLRQAILDTWDCKNKIGSSAKADGADGYYATDAFGCLITTVQPRNVPNLLTNKDVVSGTLNRFVYLTGPAKPRQYLGNSILPLFGTAIGDLTEIRDWVQGFAGSHVMMWTDESRKMFLDWAYNIFEPVRVKSPDILNRAEMQIKKIIMLFAVNSMHDQIELEDVEAALKLWPSMLSIYQLMATSVGQSVMTQVEERILSIIKRYEEKNPNDALSPSKIYDRVNNNGNKIATREELNKALLNLERMGELKEVPPGKRPDGSDITGPGRRSTRWATA